MITFKIIKKANNTFWHLFNNSLKEVHISDFDIVLDFEKFIIQCKNGSNVPNLSINISEISITVLGVESYGYNASTLLDKLIEIGYTPYVDFGLGIVDAPSDGQIYGRQNGVWVIVTSGSGGLNPFPTLYTTPKFLRKGFGKTDETIKEIGDFYEFGIDATNYCTLGRWNGTTYDIINLTIDF